MDMKLTLRAGKWPVYGWLGLGLAITFWILNWYLSGLRTQWGFFPMWLGYCLTVDALVFTRKGHSLLTRSPSAYAALFLISVPAWWIFEIINMRTQNWYYLGEQYFTDAEYLLSSSLSFSTVMPAVFGTAELAGTFTWINRIKSNLRFEITPARLIALFATGFIMLLLMLIWPIYFFCFVWLSVYLMLEPLNAWLKNRTLLQYISAGNWKPHVRGLFRTLHAVCPGSQIGLHARPAICGRCLQSHKSYIRANPDSVRRLPQLIC